MVIRSVDDLLPEALFGRLLFTLGAKRGLTGPTAIANALYDNDTCFKLFSPAGRVKYRINEEKDKEAIFQRVKEHLKAVSVIDIKKPSYLLAYSELFHCSLDYLYGKIEDECPNVEVLDISKKTGLSCNAVEKLMANAEVCMEEYLSMADRLGLFDAPPPADPGDEDEDGYYDTYASVSKFWSDLIESDQFTRLPENWHRLVCAMYTKTGVKISFDNYKSFDAEKLTADEFSGLSYSWQRLFPHDELFIKPQYCEEVFETDPNQARDVFVEVRNEFCRKLEEMSEELENTIMGYTGKIQRDFIGLLENKAAEWQRSGPFPPLEKYIKKEN